MRHKRFRPDDPREWLNRARSNLARAKTRIRGAYLEDLCFDAQQAAEKAIKAVLVCRQIRFPLVHDISQLLTRLEQAGERVPRPVLQAERLTRFAVETRYPGMAEPVTRNEYERAVRIAEAVLQWATGLIGAPPAG